MKKKPKPIQAELFKEGVDDYLPFVFTDEEEKTIAKIRKDLLAAKELLEQSLDELDRMGE